MNQTALIRIIGFLLMTAVTIAPRTASVFAASPSEKKPLIITQVIEGPLAEAGKQMLTAAYQHLDIPIVFQLIPGERALMMTNSGETDGEMFRVDNMQEKYPDLVQVPVSYIRSENVVFTKNVDFRVSGWESLRPYIIGLRIGLKQGEAGTEGMKRYLTDGSEQAFMMLTGGRVQIVFEEYLTGLEIISRRKLQGIRVLEPPLTTNPLYHYLNKRHKVLAGELGRVFQEMKDNGNLQRIFDTAVRDLMKGPPKE